MFWFNKKKDGRLIDYTEMCWGHAIVVDDRDSHKMHGWYSDMFFDGISNGDLIFQYHKDGVWIARVHDVENCNDPGDMFFCKYKTIKSEKQLSKTELSELDRLLEKYRKENG